jgi:hypothetical protein
MAKYDYGGGCPCGLFRECESGCSNYRVLDQKYSIPTVKKKEKKMKEDYDFGFSFGDSTEFSSEVDIATQKLEKLRAMILPFLNNLKQNPEKDIIKWEGKDRVKKIEDFIKKINDLVDS